DRRHTVRRTVCSSCAPLLPDPTSFEKTEHIVHGLRVPPGEQCYARRTRSSGTSTRLMPLKLKSSSTRYVGGSAAICWTIVPSASCTFWLKATPLIVRPLRFTFTRWFGSNTPEPPEDHLVAGLHHEGSP